jgi:hypothetical protein
LSKNLKEFGKLQSLQSTALKRPLFDHFIGAHEQCWRYLEATCVDLLDGGSLAGDGRQGSIPPTPRRSMRLKVLRIL